MINQEALNEIRRAINNKDNRVSRDTLFAANDAMSTLQRMECNGYKNHATHELSMILDLNAEMQKIWLATADKAKDREYPESFLADIIKDWVEGIKDGILNLIEEKGGKNTKEIYKVILDLLSTTIWTIDYYHLAENLINYDS